ncbi:amino acid ABC transporter permease [Phyllobacterium chamaecytisi]|uniref:amino acid ABC transporter permease n=1 Tax=Phyllobacterium chamaecytisi TaxID=2876082 RepID=UPI001CC919EE|nr:ABC transporter permease subunit [Phyllobacterium sp. KW56]MBZ9603195.1 ABC transporter permease subunit [Phyllobacterium sp. KW56]
MPGPKGPGSFNAFLGWWGRYPVTQFVVFIGLLAIFWIMGSNTIETMHRLGITPGFGFLHQSANFAIGESLIAYAPSDTFARAVLAGLLNTIAIALSGCVLATVLGVSLGIARLSGNFLLAGLVRWYVEVVRNTPLLLQLFFWSAVTHAFPAPRQAINPFGVIYLSNRGISIPSLQLHDIPASAIALSMAIVLTVVCLARLRAGKRTGAIGFLSISFFVLLGVSLVFHLSGAQANIDVPALHGFNITGGLNLTPEFAALLIGLVVNSSATIAEIVRSGIQSVPAGQWESARSLGLQPGKIMRLVILPQALRVIIPLMTSSYLDLTKNSSLAVAIGFPDLVSVLNTTANQSGQVLEALAIIVVSYLTLNLAVSAIMNRYNQRIESRGFSLR